MSSRYIPLMQQNALEAEAHLHKVAAEQEERIVSKMPLLRYLETDNPQKADVEKARAKYSADLDKAVAAIDKLDTLSDEAKTLALFEPAVNDVLRKHPEYCDSLSSLLNQVKSAATKRAVGTSAAAIATGAGCLIAGVLSDGILALPCFLAGGTADTAVSLGAASDANKEMNVLYAGYLGRQVGPREYAEREAEANSYLVSAGFSAIGTAAVLPGAMSSVKAIPEVLAADAANAPKPIPRMQAKWAEEPALDKDATVFQRKIRSPARELTGGKMNISMQQNVLTHINKRHVMNEVRRKDLLDVLATAGDNPSEAAEKFKNNPRLFSLLHQKDETAVMPDDSLLKFMLEKGVKQGRVKPKNPPDSRGVMKVEVDFDIPTVKVKPDGTTAVSDPERAKGQFVLCVHENCPGQDGNFTFRRGDIISGFMDCGPNVRYLPSREKLWSTLEIKDGGERREALQAMVRSMGAIRHCP